MEGILKVKLFLDSTSSEIPPSESRLPIADLHIRNSIKDEIVSRCDSIPEGHFSWRGQDGFALSTGKGPQATEAHCHCSPLFSFPILPQIHRQL
ncbi:hypothetical protein CEXT_257201 [Caerostris extrusa]|uniref:Uncharacterized protein n=1 Tax=Caerostris extrusa TaxID=172846 RepID=A0AAV4Q3M7_CAEEX|nr:hypothetical protein CEXT_257201 [Caerostris extrusa]